MLFNVCCPYTSALQARFSQTHTKKIELFSTKKQMCSPFMNQKYLKIEFSYVKSGIILKNIHARVMVLMQDTFSECALQVYEVSLKYLWRLSSYKADMIL